MLVAIVENAHLTLTYAPEGTMLYKYRLQIRNTQKQYLKLSMPDKLKFDIWSTVVDGAPVKPAADEANRIMIPLKKSSKNCIFF